MDLSYSDISYEALNTPVDDWRLLFNFMKVNKLNTLFDAGAGNALSAQTAQAEYKDIQVHAYELINDRIKGLTCPDQVIKCADLFKVDIPKCDITFLYLPTGPLLEKILHQLDENSLIAAVESHGELFNRLEESAILVESMTQTALRHHPQMRIYRWLRPVQDFKNRLRELSFQKTYDQIHIKEEDQLLGETVWSADIEGLTITPDNYIETRNPPRRLKLNRDIKISPPFDTELIERRRRNNLRKIFIEPCGIIEDQFGIRHNL